MVSADSLSDLLHLHYFSLINFVLSDVVQKIFRFIVFRNVFIAICAVFMVWETQWFLGIPLQITPLILFVFFATFFEYNLHIIAGRFSFIHPLESLSHLFSPEVSPTLKFCIVSGFLGCVATFFMLEKLMMAGFIISGLITLSYSLPMVKRNGKFIRLREFTYLKVFTVAMGWTLITVAVPLLPYLQTFSKPELALILIRRFLFIFAITIPFEIRDMERERKFGNTSLPMLFGIRAMKSAGILMLVLFCLLCGLQEKFLLYDVASGKTFFYPFTLSAIAAAYLILNASDKKSKWYFKFWTDGTMILQFLLLLLFNH